ncbi:MAG TPA: HlyD family efflux transporter periplasmic adaptor subunit [Fimbriimonadaceae bacterium]|nr:HlyD family efflux transporter periplasmic adaptor subunit [Fimbriimonadaceae bacterium]
MKPSPKLLIPVTLVVALAVGGWFLDRSRQAQYSRLSGSFESRPALLASRASGRVSKLVVEEGTFVHAGDPIAILEADTTDARAEAQRQLATQAEQKLQETLNGPRQEDIDAQKANVARLQALLTKLINGPRPEEVAAAESRYRQADAAYQKAKTGARPEEIDAARAAEGQAAAKLAAAKRGPTEEEKSQLAAARDSAAAREENALNDWNRAKNLYAQGAISKQAADAAETAYKTAQAAHTAAEEAYKRAKEGTPPEELQAAEQAYQQAKANRELVEAGPRKEDVEAARQQMLAAKNEYEVLKRGSRKEDIDAMRASVAQAQAVLDAMIKGARKEVKAQAEAASKAASAQADAATTVSDEKVIRATTDCLVERLLVAVGDLLQPGTPVAEVTDPSDIWIRVYVPEKNLAQIKVGDKATLRVDGIDGTLQGHVESIATRGEFTPANLQTPEERGKQMFGVRIRLDKPDSRVKAGMYATVTQVGGWK